MKEFELKYGCNPNQKPARIYMEDGGELPIEILERPAGIHKFSRRLQLMAAGERAEGRRSGLPAGSLLQACQPHIAPRSDFRCPKS